MKTNRLLAVGALLTFCLAGCSSPVPAPFSTPQTDSDKIPAYVQFSSENAIDSDSVRFVGVDGDRRYYVAQLEGPGRGVCVVIDNPEVSGGWAAACGGESTIGVTGAALGEARFAAAGFSGETPAGWVRLSDTVIALPPR